MRIAFTGHRPESLSFQPNSDEFHQMELALRKIIRKKIEEGCDIFYCGAARGIDILCGEIVLSENPGRGLFFLPYVFYIIMEDENSMKVVQPIRDLDVLQKCYDIAREHDKNRKTGEVSREWLLLIGLNTGLRVSVFRRFKVLDLRDKNYAQIQAKKTGKEAHILINPQARREINRLLAGRKADEYIFQSRQRDSVIHKYKPISRQRCYQIINHIARKAGMEERIGCHTLRKTFGYHYYKMTGDVVSLQRILCHSYQRETLVYIGVVQENIDESPIKFDVLTGKSRKKGRIMN